MLLLYLLKVLAFLIFHFLGTNLEKDKVAKKTKVDFDEICFHACHAFPAQDLY